MAFPKFSRHWPWLVVLFFMLGGGTLYYSRVRPLATTYDEGPIANGQVVTASVTGTDILSWSFYQPSGARAILAGVNKIGTEAHFYPWVRIKYPNGTVVTNNYSSYPGTRALTVGTLSQSGPYTVTVQNFYGSSYPTETWPFTLNLSQGTGAFVVPDGATGGSLTTGQSESGAIYGVTMAQWSYPVASGDHITLTVTDTNLDPNFNPYIVVSKPDGTYQAGTYGGTSASETFTATQTGNYQVMAGDFYGYYAGPFAYSVEGTGSSVLPSECEADGAYCLNCNIGGCHKGDPINPATGNLFEHYVDYTTVGTNPLTFERYYNSLSYAHGVAATALGTNWRSNYDRSLYLATSTLTAAQRPTGRW